MNQKNLKNTRSTKNKRDYSLGFLEFLIMYKKRKKRYNP